MTLRQRAKIVSHHALIAQRLKRLPSIAIKLKHNPAMKLSQMQDIGGCRAIMPSMKELRKLIAAYETSKSKNPRTGRPVQHDYDDYLLNPKPDGYRSYLSLAKTKSAFEINNIKKGM